MAEVYPCGVCQRPVGDNDKAVGCDGECDTWFHIECVQLSLTAYEHLIAEEQASWVCDPCGVKQMAKMLAQQANTPERSKNPQQQIP